MKGDLPKKDFCDNVLVLQWNKRSKTKSTKLMSMLSIFGTGDLIHSGKKNQLKDLPMKKPDMIVD